MRIYLAAAWSRKAEIRAVAVELNKISPDIFVHSRWLEEPGDTYGGVKNETTPTQRAQTDIDDVAAADVLVRFTDDLTQPMVSSKLVTGARMFEMGYAYALGKDIVVVGGIQPIFDYLPHVVHVENVYQLKEYLIAKELGYSVGVKRG